MEEDVKAVERLAHIIDAACNKNPHNREIIEAFRPIMLECRRLIYEPLTDECDRVDFDEERYKAGAPLIQQHDLFAGAFWEEIVLALIPRIIQGIPIFKDDLERLADYLHAHPRALSENMLAELAGPGERLESWALEIGIGPQALVFATRNAMRVILTRRARAWKDLLEGFAWDRGYCPICGSAPIIACIEEGIPRRWLNCSCCGQAWQFSRVICPACANDNQRSMTYYFVTDTAQESTFTCENCKHYLVTLGKVGDLSEFDAEVSALSLIHLDVLMQEKGYHPMAVSVWNNLD